MRGMGNPCGVYSITHVESGKKYIGSSKEMRSRLSGHRKMLTKNDHDNRYLQFAWNKFGENSFVFEPIIVCEEKDRIFYEQLIMDKFNVTNGEFGYNLSLMAASPTHSDETKARISIAVRKAKADGKIFGHHVPHTEETKLRIKEGKAKAKAEGRVGGRWPHPYSPELRDRISAAQKGKIPWNKGKKLSPEHAAKCRLGGLGKEPKNKGVPMSEEQKKKISISRKGIPAHNKGKKMAQSQIDQMRKSRLGVKLGSYKSGNILKTNCPKGHFYSGDNLYIAPNTNRRACKACMRAASRKYRSAK